MITSKKMEDDLKKMDDKPPKIFGDDLNKDKKRKRPKKENGRDC